MISYGTDLLDMYRQVGLYTAKGANPADLPVLQSTKRYRIPAAYPSREYVEVATTSREIEAALASIARDRADALFVAAGGFSTPAASSLRRSRCAVDLNLKSDGARSFR